MTDPTPKSEPAPPAPVRQKVAIWPIVVGTLGFLGGVTGLLNYFGISGQTLMRAAAPQWDSRPGIHAFKGQSTLPDFPSTLTGFQPAGDGQDFFGDKIETEGTLRLSAGTWQRIQGFPVTMNECTHGMYMLRWRAANPDSSIESASDYSPQSVERGQTQVASGNVGYMTGNNCSQPLFRYVPEKGSSGNMTDVVYKLTFWKAGA